MNRGRQFESCKYKQINEKILFCHRCMNIALATNSLAKTRKSKSSTIYSIRALETYDINLWTS